MRVKRSRLGLRSIAKRRVTRTVPYVPCARPLASWLALDERKAVVTANPHGDPPYRPPTEPPPENISAVATAASHGACEDQEQNNLGYEHGMVSYSEGGEVHGGSGGYGSGKGGGCHMRCN